MENYYSTVQTTAGNVVNGASVTVYDASTGLAATIYEPDGVTPLSNPFISGYARSEGEIEFGAANGQYNIRIVNGTETDWIYRISLFDTSLSGLGALAYEDNASGVPITDVGGYYTSTDVEGALQEAGADLAAHIADSTDAHDASAISIVDAGGYFASAEVESALQEEREFSLAHINNATDAHDASAISVLDTTGYYTGSDVETALAEIGAQNDIALAIGRITNPLVDLRLQNGVNLVNGAGSVTYACASTSTYIDLYGDIQTAAIDEPRFENGGYLNEPASTNYAIYSQPTVAQLSSSSGVTNEVVSWLNYFTSAIGFGDNTVTRYAYFNYSGSGLVDNVISVFVKMDDGLAPEVGTDAATGDFSLVAAGAGIANQPTITYIKDGVYRVSSYDDATGNFGVRKYTTQSARTFKVTGWGIEANRSAPTSYIPTTGTAVTRAANQIKLPVYGNIPAGDSPFSLKIVFDYAAVTGSNQYLAKVDCSTGNLIPYIDATGVLKILHGSATATGSSVSAGVRHVLVITSDGTTLTASLDGVDVISTAIGAFTVNAAAGNIALGSSTTLGSSLLAGHIYSASIYDIALTAPERRIT